VSTPPTLERWKPRAPVPAQLALAAGLWTVVGSLLLLFGARWTLAAAGPPRGTALLALGIAVGILKGRFVLDRTARRIADRIVERGDGRCAGGFLSWRSWLLVAAMSAAGRFLRGVLVPPVVLGPVYAAVGSGLLWSSRIAWRRLGSRTAP